MFELTDIETGKSRLRIWYTCANGGIAAHSHYIDKDLPLTFSIVHPYIDFDLFNHAVEVTAFFKNRKLLLKN